MKTLKGIEATEAKEYLKVAAKASKKARCLKRPRGVVIVLDKKVIAEGANAPADSHMCKTCLRDRKKPLKFEEFNTEPCYSVHGEQRAIINAYKAGYSDLSNAKMYFTRVENNQPTPVDDAFSCTICAKIMYEAGIKSFTYEIKDKGIVEVPIHEFLKNSFIELDN